MRLLGIDEAGRGPLVGSVVAAGVILHPDRPINGLMDSKKLSEKRREALYEEIISKAEAFHIAEATAAEIDRYNILNATLLAMKRVANALAGRFSHIEVDGNRLPDWDYAATAVVKGDQKVTAISAASILAKVTRDRQMYELDKLYPQYGFASHKGYPTKQHLQMLAEHGALSIHRWSFSPVSALLH
ncbi:MAG: ribonuclease HII [Francisellaceae bacterium]